VDGSGYYSGDDYLGLEVFHMKLLTAEQLGEIRERHEEERVGKYHKFEVVNGVQGQLQCRMDSGELLVHIDRQSLIEHIDALQDNMHTFQETIQSAMDEVNS